MRSVWIAGLPLSSPPLTTTVETATGPDDGGVSGHGTVGLESRRWRSQFEPAYALRLRPGATVWI